MKIMVREMSLIRGLGAPAKEMSFPHLLALFKDLTCLQLPTISRHFPLFPAKKMSQSLVASQHGRSARGPGRVPRAAPRSPGVRLSKRIMHQGLSRCAAQASANSEVFTNHETRLFSQWVRKRRTIGTPRPDRRARAARSLLSCALWRGIGRLWRGMGGRRPPHRQHGL